MIQAGSITSDTMALLTNIDGLPIAKSSRKQFWPILAAVEESTDIKPFVIALFVENTKPESLQDYMSDFTAEVSMLGIEGFTQGDKKFTVQVRAFICDAPVRAFLKCIEGHGGYYSCERCTQEGVYSESSRKVILSELNDPLRTDEAFLNQDQEEHHRRHSPLTELKIAMVSDFPLDYVHLVCLGGVRNLLHYWVRGVPHRSKVPVRVQNEISEMLINLQKHTPREMALKPRSLCKLERWKATEFRNFLFYFGPVVLSGRIEKYYYQHFMNLSVTVSMLSSPEPCHLHLNFAKNLLRWFVTDAGHLYGEGVYVYNVHALVHLPDDVQKFGHLDSFSTFPFENLFGSIEA